MAKFINLILKHRIFNHIFRESNVYNLEKFNIQRLEKVDYNRYIIKDLVLTENLIFQEVDFFSGTVDPKKLFRISFLTSDENFYTNSDEFFDSDLNDWKELGDRSKLRGIGRNRKTYTDKLIGYGYHIRYSVTPHLVLDGIYSIIVSVYRSDLPITNQN